MPFNCDVKLDEKHHRAQVTKHKIKLNANSELFRLHSSSLITWSTFSLDYALKPSSLHQHKNSLRCFCSNCTFL